ncbi:integral membrane protein GPR180-like isoform X2 [Ornithodoros turicata]|uniref:integral membrane protein GPR180-like isoform X2 n=1 Tax=Ornithodoros turicata TaxID=34597 RepID=UPI003139D9F9
MHMYTVLTLALAVWVADGLHLHGTFRTGKFFTFLAKFGFKKTDRHDHENTLGYIYGNITSSERNITHRGTLVVVDRDTFLSYYGNRSVTDRRRACELMFTGMNKVAFDSSCNVNGTQDFLRNIPCQPGKLCEDEDKPSSVVRGNQFTYAVRDLHQARFWYISMVSCYRIGDKKTCQWKESSAEDIPISYNIWMVNGNPGSSSHNIFEYQFSFEQQGSLERVLLFLVLYLILTCLQIYAALRQHHLVTRLFTVALTLQLLSFLWTITHLGFFAWDGVGVSTLGIVGDVTYMLSQSLFMLLLLLLAKGWAITRTELTWKPVLFCIWLIYSCIQILLYIWNMTEVDVIEEIDEYQTYPGWISLCFRLIITAWFLSELRSTMADENDHRKLRFYLHFGAGMLCWFVYLPVVALIALQVSALWRQKFILGISSCADFLAYAIVTHLLWPTRSQQYFQLKSVIDPGDELEELNEAPQNVQQRTRKRSNPYREAY